MPKGDKILASEYNGWWTTLNTIRKSWDAPGTEVTPVTVSGGIKATADNMNSLINQVNALATFYSGADWTNFTESTKAVGQKIEYPSKMTYMLDYLSTVCNFCSTFANDSVNGTNSTDSTYTNNSTHGTFTNNSTDGTDSTDGTFGNDSVQGTQSTQSTDGTQSTDTVQSTNSRFSTNHTEPSGHSKRFGDTKTQNNNGTCTGFTGF
jgi:hypothetical protein